MRRTVEDADEAVTFRMPELRDAREIMRLVREGEVLDWNSDYAYLLMCHHFFETCVVAESDGRLVGVMLGYRPPRQAGTLFVWQIAVASEARGQGLGGRMLDSAMGAGVRSGIRFVEASVTPSNTASRALFESLARRHNVDCRITPVFTSAMFSESAGHEAEDLFRIGPFSSPSHSSPSQMVAARNDAGATSAAGN